MKQKELSFMLKCVVIGVALCLLLVCALMIPVKAESFVQDGLMDKGFRIPWMISVWIAAVPCVPILIQCWGVTVDIGRDRSFSRDNAARLKRIAYLALGIVAYFFPCNLVLFLLSLVPDRVLAWAGLFCCAGLAFAVCAAALSHLVIKAAELQEENELTV